MLTQSNSLAYAVLSLVINELPEDKTLRVEPYLNGRENGFAVYLITGKKKVVFSESRNSDDIVIYEGGPYDFNMLGNGLTEEIYGKKTFFAHKDVYLAAIHIVNLLKEN